MRERGSAVMPLGRRRRHFGPMIANWPAAASRARAHVGEIVGVEARDLEGEVALAHRRMREDDGFFRDIHPGNRIQSVVVGRAAVAVGRISQGANVMEVIERRVWR